MTRIVASRILQPLTRRLVLQRTTHARLDGLQLTVPPGVFPPTIFGSTKMMARHVAALPLAKQRVLEVGTGAGAIALTAGRAGAHVIAVDIDPRAVACARANAAANHLGGAVEVLESDLFSALPPETRFDYIVFNPPMFPKVQSGPATYAWHVGQDCSVLNRFAGEAMTRLTPNGRIVLLVSSDMDIPLILGFFEGARFDRRLVASHPWLWETYHIYHFSPAGVPA
jgi:release factor glutamine methyltransferase